MIKKSYIILFILFSTTALFSKSKLDNNTIFTIDSEPTSFREFKQQLLKTNSFTDITKTDPQEFLDLYINYKLKVSGAKDMGLDTTARLRIEIGRYKDGLKEKYMYDNKASEALIKEAYDRLKQEVRVTHILIKYTDEAGVLRDTNSIFKNISNIRNKAIKGESFESLAVKFSEDPSAKFNKGDLGYFTAFKMVYKFENMAYNTPLGKVSPVFRTTFGYHILKVTDKRPAIGKVKVAHILVRKKPENISSRKPDEDAKKKINEIYKQLENGSASFEELAKKFSEDPKTQKLGGYIQTLFQAGDLLPEFYEKIISLKKDGDYTKPFEVNYGYHIAKRVETVPLEKYEMLKEELKIKVLKDARSKLSTNIMIERLKNAYKFKTYPNNIKAVEDLILNESLYTHAIQVSDFDAKKYSKPVFEFKPFGSDTFRTFTQFDLFKFYYLNQPLGKKDKLSLPILAQTINNRFYNKEILDAEREILDKKYIEYADLSREYENGLLLYEAMNRKVWKKSLRDSAGLYNFYTEHKNSYKHPERILYSIYDCKSKEILKNIQKDIKLNQTIEDSILRSRYNKDSQLNLSKMVHDSISVKQFEKKYGQNRLKKGQYELSENGRYQLLIVKKKLPIRTKKLEEARGEILNDFQKKLEKDWITEIKKNKKIEVNKQLLKTL